MNLLLAQVLHIAPTLLSSPSQHYWCITVSNSSASPELLCFTRAVVEKLQTGETARSIRVCWLHHIYQDSGFVMRSAHEARDNVQAGRVLL